MGNIKPVILHIAEHKPYTTVSIPLPNQSVVNINDIKSYAPGIKMPGSIDSGSWKGTLDDVFEVITAEKPTMENYKHFLKEHLDGASIVVVPSMLLTSDFDETTEVYSRLAENLRKQEQAEDGYIVLREREFQGLGRQIHKDTNTIVTRHFKHAGTDIAKYVKSKKQSIPVFIYTNSSTDENLFEDYLSFIESGNGKKPERIRNLDRLVTVYNAFYGNLMDRNFNYRFANENMLLLYCIEKSGIPLKEAYKRVK
jgi:hypothetical protein